MMRLAQKLTLSGKKIYGMDNFWHNNLGPIFTLSEIKTKKLMQFQFFNHHINN